jgi:hypothetical protein
LDPVHTLLSYVLKICFDVKPFLRSTISVVSDLFHSHFHIEILCVFFTSLVLATSPDHLFTLDFVTTPTGMKHCNSLTEDTAHFRSINTYQQSANGKLNSSYRTNAANEPISRRNCLKFSNKRHAHYNMGGLGCVLTSYGVILHRRNVSTARSVSTTCSTCRAPAVVSTLRTLFATCPARTLARTTIFVKMFRGVLQSPYRGRGTRHDATSQKVAGSSPDEVDFF